MKFSEIVARLTGFSIPVCGVSWQPKEPEIDAARRIVTFLEDRRVLYSPSEMEMPDHCVQSVLGRPSCYGSPCYRTVADAGMVPAEGLEPPTPRLRSGCSTN
jgi:uncharacterized protein DUF6650